MSKEQLKTSVKQKNEETAGDIKEKRAAMKTIKELNKDLKGKAWYRLLSVLWIVFYIVFLLLVILHPKTKGFGDALGAICITTISVLGATVFFKRAVYYAAYYITTGNIFLKELNIKERLLLLFIFLWGILSSVILVAFLQLLFRSL